MQTEPNKGILLSEVIRLGVEGELFYITMERAKGSIDV